MKRSVLSIIAFLFALLANAQSWLEFSPSETTEPKYDLITSTDSLVKFTVDISGLFEMEIDSFYRVQVKNHTRMDSVGFPEMPIVSFLVAIPECDSVNLNLSLTDSISFSNYNIYPAPELVPDTIEGGGVALIEQFAYNRTAYETDAMFPGTVAETIDKGAIRAQHVVRVVLYPLQFNPVKKIIKAYSNIEVSLSFYNATGNLQQNVGIFNEVVGNTLINYNSSGLNASVNCGAGLSDAGSVNWITDLPNQKIDSACDYLIITHNEFYIDNAAKQAIDSLAAHRANFNGFDVAIITTNTIYPAFPDTLFPKERIKKLIENTYNDENANHTYDSKLAYVNLFGDAFFGNDPMDICIPTHQEGYDVYFTQLTQQGGTYDIYPDLMIGRCSVDTVTQVENIVNKTKGFKPDDLDWKYEMYMVSGNYAPSTVSDILFDMYRGLGDAYNIKQSACNEVLEKGVPPWPLLSHSKANLLSEWAEGKMFVNYMGHGGYYKWNIGNFMYDDLDTTHENRLPFAFGCACSSGSFHNNDDCMAEKFLCNDEDKGAISFVASSQASYADEFPIMAHFYHAVVRNNQWVSGEAMMEAKIALNVQSGMNKYNLFGDPALHLLYENADTILPDITIKMDSIKLSPAVLYQGVTLEIEAELRNHLWASNNETIYYTSCLVVDTLNYDTIWVGNESLSGIDGFESKWVEFEWITGEAPANSYKVVIIADTSNSIAEMSDDNNINYKYINLYYKDDVFPIQLTNNLTTNLVGFDFNSLYSGEEILCGSRIYSNQGALISDDSVNTYGITSVGGLYNNGDPYIVQFQKYPEPSVPYRLIAKSVTSSWSLDISASKIAGPVIGDLDMDGEEEVILQRGLTD